MKTDVIDMLVYLFENGFVDIADALDESPDSLQSSEHSSPCEITLPGDGRTIYLQASPDAPIPSVRVFTEEEQRCMTSECREAILLLVRLGVLDYVSCELVVEYLLMLDEKGLDIEDLKWAVVMAFVTEPMEKLFDTIPEENIIDDEAPSWH